MNDEEKLTQAQIEHNLQNQQKINESKNRSGIKNAKTTSSNSSEKLNNQVNGAKDGTSTVDKLKPNNKSKNINNAASKALDHAGLKGKIAKAAIKHFENKTKKNKLKSGNSSFNSNNGNSPSMSDRLLKKGPKDMLNGLIPFGGANQGLFNTKDKLEEQNQNEGLVNVKIPKKAILTAVLIVIPFFALIIFSTLLIVQAQMFLNVNTLSQADSVSESNIEQPLDKSEDEMNKSVDDDLSFTYDIYIDDDNDNFKHYEFAKNKYTELTVIDENNKVDILNELKNYYPDIIKYTGDEYEQNDVYKFYLKLYYIYKYYEGKGVKLNMPLLMSVLNLQSQDMGEIFKANTVDYDMEKIKLGSNNPDFDIKKDWSSYKSTKNNSSHDIEVLAQAMVKEGNSSSNKNDSKNNSDRVVSKTGKEAIDKMTEIALQEAEEGHYGGEKYWSWFGYSSRDEWCAMFVSWLFNQIGGIDKYIIKSAAATYISRYSVQNGYGTWLEDECTDPSTVPAPGDVILFDGNGDGAYAPYPQNGGQDGFFSSHVGYVYDVDDTYVYTVEGNTGGDLGMVKKKQYERKTHCGTYGLQGINGYYRPNY